MTQQFTQFQQLRPTVKPERIDIPSYHAQQALINRVPPPPGYGGVPAKTSKPPSQVENEENIENLPDFPSIKGIFGWTTVDQVNIPYILRHDEQFVSVRIVEMKLLSKYPNSYPDDLGKHAPLTSYFVTANEAKLLNEINLTHCGGEYGKKEFNTKDLIVLLSDFIAFFKLVKKTFPDGNNSKVEEDQGVNGVYGWMQIKNTVSPYVKRRDGKYVPLSVMQHAAGLVKQGVTGVSITIPEKDLLNRSCKSAGVNFQFSENTKLIRIDQILAEGAHAFRELPTDDPLKHAHYMELPTSNSQSSNAKINGLKTGNTPVFPNQSQKQNLLSNPYQFQQRLPFHQTNLNGRLPMSNQAPGDSSSQNPQHMNRPPPRYPFPPMFDMRFPAMYGGGGGRFPPFFPQGNGIPNGPPNASLPQGFPNVSVLNSGPHINPLAQYYMDNGSKNSSTGSGRAVPPQLSASMTQGPPVNYDTNKKSPGAQSTTPSPRSRHASGSRPPSGSRPSSRPPSESPLSPNMPNNFVLPQFSNQSLPPSTQTSQPYQLPGGQTMAQLQGLIQNIQPSVGPRNSTPSISYNPLMQIPNNNLQNSATNGHVLASERLNTNVNNNPTESQSKSHDTVNSAKTTVNENSSTLKSRPVPVGLNMAQSILEKPIPESVPPPLLRMANPKPETSEKIVPEPATVPAISNSSKIVKEQPVPKAVSAVSSAPPAVSYTDSIKGAWLNNKSISCLHLDKANRKGRFCLVEAVCKLYFNGYSVHEFLFALEKVLNVNLVICNDEEEKAFIQYYSLPVEVLKCNKMIEFDDLKKFFPQLSYMFPDKNSPDLGLTLDNSEGESGGLDQDNNNSCKTISANGLMSADELENSALPMTVTQIESRQGDKRSRESPAEQPSKQAKLDQRSEDQVEDDAVIILD